jgi:hypothetical protein
MREDYYMSIEQKIIYWLIIFGVLIIDIAFIPIGLFYLWPDLRELSTAILAFTGAIIGGSLTLFGVLLTLKNQRIREQEQKMSISESLYLDLLYPLTDLRGVLERVRFTPFEEILEKTNELELKTAEVLKYADKTNVRMLSAITTVHYTTKEIKKVLQNPDGYYIADNEDQREILESHYFNKIKDCDENLINILVDIETELKSKRRSIF